MPRGAFIKLAGLPDNVIQDKIKDALKIFSVIPLFVEPPNSIVFVRLPTENEG